MAQPARRIDAHVHYCLPLTAEFLADFLDSTGTEKANLVMVPHTKKLSCVPEALMAKAKFPGKFYVFTSLDPSNYFIHSKSVGLHMARFVRRMLRCGCDGVKIIEGKPTMRKMMPIPDFDQPTWEPFWAFAEQEQVPILWHLNDPQEYWDPSQATDYRIKHGDVYDESFVNNEAQYAQVERILQRHPALKIIFAHFYFMSGQLERLGDLFDRFPNIMVDMTPGSEMYRILSADHDRASAFFCKYSDRIIYGTDIAARCVMANRLEVFNEKENRCRAELIDGLFTPGLDHIHEPDGEYLIDVPAFRLRGLDIPQQVVDQIYGENFLRFVGGEPVAVHPGRIIRECRRLQVMVRMMSLFSPGMEPDDSGHRATIAYFQNRK